jgi:hypothetical protein
MTLTDIASRRPAADGVELAIRDRVVCKVVPPLQVSEAEKVSRLAEGKELLRRARERNKGVPARVIEREIREAVRMVRNRRR